MNLSKNYLDKKPLIIAEVGQNHQGSVLLAKKYIKVFASMGANIIKFQARDNKLLFDKESYNSVYNSENAFAATYGKHREKLELSKSNLKILSKECKKHKVKFMCTPFDENSLKNICAANVDLIKIASFDLGNLNFLAKVAQKKKIVVMSVGGGNDKEIFESIKIFKKYKTKIILLHCVSEYPCEYNRLDLKKILLLKKKYPKIIIGSSDHFNGILSGPLAYMLGARVFEKHVTFNRSWKGSDHSFALEPDGFKKFVRDIYRTPLMIQCKSEKKIGKEAVFKKLGKSVIANKKIRKGKKISIQDLSGKIFSKQYLPIRKSYIVVGKLAKKNIECGEFITLNKIK